VVVLEFMVLIYCCNAYDSGGRHTLFEVIGNVVVVFLIREKELLVPLGTRLLPLGTGALSCFGGFEVICGCS